MNVFMFNGRLTKDPEQLKTKNGKSFVSLRVAIDRKFKTHDKADADYFTCFAYDAQAAFILRHFNKGDSIVVRGRIENRDPYVTRSGDTLKEDLVIIEDCSIGREKRGKQVNNSTTLSDDNNIPDTSSYSGALTEDDFNNYLDQIGYSNYTAE